MTTQTHGESLSGTNEGMYVGDGVKAETRDGDIKRKSRPT